MSSAPVNAKISDPTVIVPDWATQAQEWRDLNANAGGDIHGNPDCDPLTIKAAYIVGVVHGLCESVAWLLHVSHAIREVTYLPAYGIFASGIELMGRCINGNATPAGSTDDLRMGFQWL